MMHTTIKACCTGLACMALSAFAFAATENVPRVCFSNGIQSPIQLAVTSSNCINNPNTLGSNIPKGGEAMIPIAWDTTGSCANGGNYMVSFGVTSSDQANPLPPGCSINFVKPSEGKPVAATQLNCDPYKFQLVDAASGSCALVVRLVKPLQ